MQLQAVERDARVIEHEDLHIGAFVLVESSNHCRYLARDIVHGLPVTSASASNLAGRSAGRFHG